MAGMPERPEEYRLIPAYNPDGNETGYYTREPDGVSGMSVGALARFVGAAQTATITQLLDRIRDADPLTNTLSDSLKAFAGKELRLLTNDPHGLGPNQPSVGFGFGMMERYGGLPTSASDNWLEGLPNTDSECLKLPSGNTYRVSRITGFGYNMMEEHGGLPQSTVTDWRVTGEEGETYLKDPKGSTFRVTGVKGLDGNTYSVIEVSQWVAIAAEAIKKSGVKKQPRISLLTSLAGLQLRAYYSRLLKLLGTKISLKS